MSTTIIPQSIMMSTIVPPSTGKKKKARRVFGDVVIEDLNHSLSYSPSPFKLDAINEDSKSLATLSEEDASTIGDSSASTSSSSEKDDSTIDKRNVSSFDKENTQRTSQRAPKMKKRVVVATLKNNNRQILSHEKRSPLRPDLVKKTQDAISRASESVRRTLLQSSLLEKNIALANSVNQGLIASRRAKEDSHRQKEREVAQIRQEWQEDVQNAKYFNNEAQKYRQETNNIHRQLSSHVSKQKANQHQQIKLSTLQKIEENTNFCSLVYREHQDKLREEKERRRRISSDKKMKQRENHQRGIESMKMIKRMEENVILEERYAYSVATRTFAQDNSNRRRKSFAFRNGDAKRIRDVFAAMETKRQHDDYKRYELKRASEKDVEEYKRSLEEQRRQSFAGRNEYASNQRKVFREETAKQNKLEHQSFELKWDGERDAKLSIKQENERRRLSFALRNEIGRAVRIKEMECEAKERQREHLSYELKQEADRDVDNYKRLQEFARRKSFEKRGEDSRRQNQILKQKESVVMKEEHESYELKRNAEKDVEAYKCQLELERRVSLANRNRECVQHAKLMTELQALTREKESESYVLKWAGEADAKAYLDHLEEEKRKSLQLRGTMTLQARVVEESQRQQELQHQRNDEIMKSNDQKDVTVYKKECADRDRRSLEYRRKEARLQRIHAQQIEQQQYHNHVDGFLLDTQAWVDVQEYVKECKVRRRHSLAFRAKEKRKHVEWEKRRIEHERKERSKFVRDQLYDQRHVELARQKERAQHALEAIQHLGRCNTNTSSSSSLSTLSNPFATILR